MIKLVIFTVLSLFSVSAFAYENTTFKLTLTRETIRDDHPATVANVTLAHVKYDQSGVCYIIGARYEYPCIVEFRGDGYGYAFTLSMTGENFQSYVSNEFSWIDPSYKAEFLNFFSKQAVPVFTAADYRDPRPALVALHPIAYKSADGKITYLLK